MNHIYLCVNYKCKLPLLPPFRSHLILFILNDLDRACFPQRWKEYKIYSANLIKGLDEKIRTRMIFHRIHYTRTVLLIQQIIKDAQITSNHPYQICCKHTVLSPPSKQNYFLLQFKCLILVLPCYKKKCYMQLTAVFNI